MDDRCVRRVEHLAPRSTDGKREIGVLVVSRPIADVETTQRLPHAAGHGNARAGTVIGFAQVIEFGTVGIVATADVPRAAVAPYDPARLLQPAIGVDELRADEACVRVCDEHGKQRFQPARG